MAQFDYTSIQTPFEIIDAWDRDKNKTDSDIISFVKKLGIDDPDFFERRKEEWTGVEKSKKTAGYFENIKDEYEDAMMRAHGAKEIKAPLKEGDWLRKKYTVETAPKSVGGFQTTRGATSTGLEESKRRDIIHKKGQADKIKKEEEIKKKIADAKLKAEEEAAYKDTFKGRLGALWEDADKRDAILGGIADAMLETRTGAEAYGSRISQAQKNVRQNLKLAEATDIARAQAALDMQKTAAETSKLLNPAQFMSSTQKEASDIASMEHVYGSPEWKEKYASEIRRIAYEDMLSGPVDAIMAINEYMFKMQGQLDPTMTEIYKDIINQLMGTIQGAAGGTGAASVRGVNDIIGKTGQE